MQGIHSRGLDKMIRATAPVVDAIIKLSAVDVHTEGNASSLTFHAAFIRFVNVSRNFYD